MKIKHLFVSILLATGFQPMIAQSALRQQFVNSSVQEARLPKGLPPIWKPCTV